MGAVEIANPIITAIADSVAKTCSGLLSLARYLNFTCAASPGADARKDPIPGLLGGALFDLRS